jgi:hypothetical protein
MNVIVGLFGVIKGERGEGRGKMKVNNIEVYSVA